MVAPREMNHAWMHDPQGTGSLLQFCESVILPSRPSDSNRSSFRSSMNHLAKFLGHDPSIAELTSLNLNGTFAMLVKNGRQRTTVDRVRRNLLAIALEAHQHEVLAELPRVTVSDLPKTKPVQRSPSTPWSLAEFELMFASARTVPGDIAGIAARRWWPAFLFILFDTEVSASELLKAPRSAFEASCGELAVGLFRHRLHPLVIDAINAMLPHSYDNLFPWPWDRGKAGDILYRRMKQLLFRANLPYTTADLFERLRVTARDTSGFLDRMNLELRFRPRVDKPRVLTARDRTRLRNQALKPETKPVAKVKSSKKKTKPVPVVPEVLIRVQMDTSISLSNFLKESYAPQRLADSSVDLVDRYHLTIDHLSCFLACDATFEHLVEDIVERFLAWLKKSDRFANATINGYRAMLLALWRHAWRKSKVKELPRDIHKFKVSKLIPEAWSPDEMGMMLKAAREATGDVCGAPSSVFWPALILTLYDTGLRIAALMQAKLSDFDFESRWLKIPAEVQKQDADQVFRLHEETVDAIARIEPAKRELIFPWPFDADNRYHILTDHFRKILKAAGLSDTKRDLFHRIRRTSATAVAQVLGEAAAQHHLGHSSISVTKRYLDPRKLAGKQSPSESIERPRLASDQANRLGSISEEIKQ